MKKYKQLIIIGGGFSIKEGIDKGLWKKIKDKFVIGCNYSYKYFPTSTIQCYVDRDFYKKEKEDMKNLQLIVGQEVTEKKFIKAVNTIYTKCHHKYKRDLKTGIYKPSLAGIFALSLGIFLLDEGEIFLLGMDYGESRKCDHTKYATSKQILNKIVNKDSRGRAITHFYQEEINHRGIGKANYYNAKNRADRDYGVYSNEKKVKIYNVSLNSKITTFPKISYNEFFKKLDKNKYNQKELKEIIIKKLGGLK